jgi:2-dehydropantoate 2-reductase
MRIAIMGTGAVGAYFGAHLAKAGHDVTFIARGAHLQAMRTQGLAVRGPRGDIVLPKVAATDTPGEVAPVDVVLFCVKLYDTESSAQAIAPLLARGGVCISLQNGVDGQERIGAIVGRDRVMGGLAFVSGVIEAPGVIRYTSNMSSIRFGETDGALSERGARFRDACTAAGFGAELVTDIRSVQWQKFVGLATNAALSCLVRKPAGVVYRDPDLIPIARAAFAEVEAVARAQGIAMPEGIVEQQLAQHQNFPPQMYASMYHDLARGRPIEVESLSGVVVRKGREFGVPTPVHAIAYACLKPHVHGERPAVAPA